MEITQPVMTFKKQEVGKDAEGQEEAFCDPSMVLFTFPGLLQSLSLHLTDGEIKPRRPGA